MNKAAEKKDTITSLRMYGNQWSTVSTYKRPAMKDISRYAGAVIVEYEKSKEKKACQII